ncbi:hypothetical protein BHU72_02120 [Desulfuribacillus stibiiarsenatis]|uniref:General secretion pathway GspH domain-containing protein n=1 Tax=Desulfuribacillus stibiiarsenatis TaxID=1390249 RepID=A0A1E5L6E5_9FIRM|nr:prepilin-type N-terminal cleavage/methylation domain-containing protein [Desulfuribacillus stibiiarsenatis]OEH85618.1 hypothetical protein BHU72_02120 [Desulfuribacillus stibiiarsenatis]
MKTALNKKGFTLLETLLVVTILCSLMIPVYPLVMKQYHYYQLENEAETLAKFLEKMRQQAILEQQPMMIRFSTTEPYSYGLRSGVQIVNRHYLSQGLEMTTSISGNQFYFNFVGEPRDVGGTISLVQANGEMKQIIIHPFSGIIEVR